MAGNELPVTDPTKRAGWRLLPACLSLGPVPRGEAGSDLPCKVVLRPLYSFSQTHPLAGMSGFEVAVTLPQMLPWKWSSSHGTPRTTVELPSPKSFWVI